MAVGSAGFLGSISFLLTFVEKAEEEVPLARDAQTTAALQQLSSRLSRTAATLLQLPSADVPAAASERLALSAPSWRF